MTIKLSKEQQQYLVLAVVALGGGGFVYVKYFWLPISEKISETKKQIEEVESKISKAKTQAVRLNKIQKELDELNIQALEAERRLPKTLDLPGTIDTVSALARRYNVKLTGLSAGASKAQPHFIETSYNVDATASYHELGRLLAGLALEERIFNVRQIVYGSPDSDGRMTVKFQLVSYQYKG
ncbi:MAG: type 4a pilus biogenesis protein PilO [Elusimicrobia bacterium]|nr:type 4a pilus biogenesis protein PilO [Elusimicrobiota bacterium]